MTLRLYGSLQLFAGVVALLNPPAANIVVGTALVLGALVLLFGRFRPPQQLESDRVVLARDGSTRFAVDLAPPHQEPSSAQALQPRTVMVMQSGQELDFPMNSELSRRLSGGDGRPKSSSIVTTCEVDGATISILDKHGQRVALGANSDGTAGLLIRDQAGETRLWVGVDVRGVPEIRLRKPSGQEKVVRVD